MLRTLTRSGRPHEALGLPRLHAPPTRPEASTVASLEDLSTPPKTKTKTKTNTDGNAKGGRDAAGSDGNADANADGNGEASVVRVWGDQGTYNLLLHAARDARNASASLSLLNEMVDGGLAPTPLDYAVALQALAAASEWEPALGLVVSMDARGVAPDLRFFTVAIGCFEEASRWPEVSRRARKRRRERERGRERNRESRNARTQQKEAI